MHTSTLRVTVAAAVIALALSGCSSADTPKDAGTSSAPDATTAAPETTSTVTVWGPWSGTDEEKAQEMIDAYNASQSQYTVEYQPQEELTQKVLTAIAGGTDIPDVVIWDRYQTSLYASKGALTAVDDLVASSGIDTGDFYEAALGEMQYDGALYGLPLIVDNRSLFYNKTLFAEAGLSAPTTWEELREAAKALTVRDDSGTLVQAGFQLNDAGLFNFWCFQAGCSLVNDDQSATAFNSAQGQSVLDFWGQLLFEDKVYELGFSDGTDAFAEGKVAMKYDGPWALSTYNAIEGLDYGIVEPVAGPDGDKGAMLGGLGLVIPEGAANVDGAWDFMTWWAAEPEQGVAYAKISGWPSANKVAAEDPFFATDDYAAFVAAMDYAKVRPTVAGFSDVEKLALTPQIERFMSGETSAADALATAQSEGDAILQSEAK